MPTPYWPNVCRLVCKAGSSACGREAVAAAEPHRKVYPWQTRMFMIGNSCAKSHSADSDTVGVRCVGLQCQCLASQTVEAGLIGPGFWAHAFTFLVIHQRFCKKLRCQHPALDQLRCCVLNYSVRGRLSVRFETSLTPLKLSTYSP